jgi:hypothetical protein
MLRAAPTPAAHGGATRRAMRAPAAGAPPARGPRPARQLQAAHAAAINAAAAGPAAAHADAAAPAPAPAAPAGRVSLFLADAARRAPRPALVAVHAASSAAFMAGAAGVELFTTLPVLAGSGAPLYYPATAAGAWAWAGLVALSSASGWALAARERRGAERANFQDYALQAILGQMFTLWLSPYWPRGGGAAADVAIGAAVVAVSLAQLATQASAGHRAAIARGRRARAPAGAAAAAAASADEVSSSSSAAAGPAPAAGDLPAWAASAAYFQPAAVGPVMMAAAGAIQACVPFTWLAAFQAVHPEHAAIAFHFSLITTLAGHAGMLAPTLRDRRGLSQAAEAAVCAASSYGALALLAAFALRFPWLWQVAGPWATLWPVQ